MERMRISKLLPVLVVAALVSGSAHADWSLTPVVGGNFANLKSDPAPTTPTSSKFGLGFGALADFGAVFGTGMGLQVGALYLGNKMGDDTSSSKFSSIQIPILFRYTIDKMFSVGLGPYYSIYMGSISTEAGGVAGPDLDFATAGIKKSDLGFLASVGAAIPTGSFDLLVDVRYNMGLGDLLDPAVAGASVKSSAFQVLVGPRFAMK
jgi:hypothetical protein